MNKVTKKLYLLNNPKYLIFNLTWDESTPLLEDICKLYFCLPLTFKIDDLFNIPEKVPSVEYEIFGLICYWGAHYVCYIKNHQDKMEFWENYDDNTIMKINDWSELIKKAIKSHLHPVVLFYRTKDKKYSYVSEISIKEQEEILKYCKKYDLEKKLKKIDSKSTNTNEVTKVDSTDFTLFAHEEKADNKFHSNNKATLEKNEKEKGNKPISKDNLELIRTSSGEEWICDNCDKQNNDYSSFFCKSKMKS